VFPIDFVFASGKKHIKPVKAVNQFVDNLIHDFCPLGPLCLDRKKAFPFRFSVNFTAAFLMG
jgi:hypothetical protein